MTPEPRDDLDGEGVAARKNFADGVVHAICPPQVFRKHLLDVVVVRAQVSSNADLAIVVVL